MTPLNRILKRALTVKGREYVITLSAESVKISRKGHRLGIEMRWVDIISGDSALAVALRASVGRLEEVPATAKPLAAPKGRGSVQRPIGRKRPSTRLKRAER